ncbi:MAG: AAA family ATPase [Bacilli bacterium]
MEMVQTEGNRAGQEAGIKKTGIIAEEITHPRRKEPLFKNVIGYEDVKKELALIQSWYLDKEKREDPLLSLPKGILFYGPFGCGKTLFMREFANSFNTPVYSLTESEPEALNKLFDEAEKNPFSIVVLDELDPIAKNPYLVRALLTRMDGFEKNPKSRVLVLATTNYRQRIPEALLRSGRFDRKIKVDYPKAEERILLFRKFFALYGVKDDAVDYETLMNETDRISCATIKNIVNDAKLRLGNSLTTSGVYESYQRIALDNYSVAKPLKSRLCAIHEAGHAFMSILYDKDYRFEFMNMSENGNAVTEAPRRKACLVTLSVLLEGIEIGFGGMEAEELFFHTKSVGSSVDLHGIRNLAYSLIQEQGIEGFASLSEGIRSNNQFFVISEERKKRIERKVTRLLAREARKTRKILKKYKEDILKIADAFYEKEHLTRNEIMALGFSLSKEKYEEGIAPSASGDGRKADACGQIEEDDDDYDDSDY